MNLKELCTTEDLKILRLAISTENQMILHMNELGFQFVQRNTSFLDEPLSVLQAYIYVEEINRATVFMNILKKRRGDRSLNIEKIRREMVDRARFDHNWVHVNAK